VQCKTEPFISFEPDEGTSDQVFVLKGPGFGHAATASIQRGFTGCGKLRFA